MQSIGKQKGVGTFGFIILVIIFAFLLYLAWIITPIYFENYALKKSLKSVQSKNLISATATRGQNVNKIRNYLAKDFRVNNIYNVPLEAIKIKKSQGDYVIEIKYDVREHIIGNMDILVHFENSAKVK